MVHHLLKGDVTETGAFDYEGDAYGTKKGDVGFFDPSNPAGISVFAPSTSPFSLSERNRVAQENQKIYQEKLEKQRIEQQKAAEEARRQEEARQRAEMEKIRQQDEARYRSQPGQYNGENRQQERQQAGPGYDDVSEAGSF